MKLRTTASTRRSSVSKLAWASAAVYRWIRAIASRMSSMRSRHSLADTDCLLKDSVAQLSLEARRGDQIHAAAQCLLQVLLHLQKGEQPHRSVELDQDIYITVGPSLIARHGAE